MSMINSQIDRTSFIDIFLDGAPFGVALLDANLRHVYINKVLADMGGLEIEDLIGKTVQEALPRVSDLIDPLLQHVRSSGRPITFEMRDSTFIDSGEPKDWLCCYYPARSSDGNVHGIGVSVMDVTESNQTERRLKLITENMQDMISLHDRSGTFLYLSPSCEAITGYSFEELTGTEIYDIVHPDDEDVVRSESHTKVLAGVPCVRFTYRILTKGGEVKWLESLANPIFDNQRQVVNIQACSRDVTQQVDAKNRLRDSEERFRISVNAMHEGLILQNSDGSIALKNEAAGRILGLEYEKVTASTFDEMDRHFLRDDGSAFPRDQQPIRLALRTGLPQRNVIMGYRLRDNEQRWLSINAEPLFQDNNEKPYAAVCTFADVTDVRRFEKEKADRRTASELQRLSDQLIALQESERRRIAADLHDEIGGALTGLKLLLESIKREVPSSSNASLDHATSLVQEIIGSVREMSMDLRPTILDDMGLVPALNWYFSRYTSQTGIRIKFRINKHIERLRPEVEVTLYRFVQEALTNIARHAGVDRAVVSMTKSANHIKVSVRDHGIGFDSASALRRSDASGLTGLRERLRLIKGEFTLTASPGGGARLLATLPINMEAEDID
jgi:PAS domain S-box-containing protein